MSGSPTQKLEKPRVRQSHHKNLKADIDNRLMLVEACMLKGLSSTQMVDLKLGSWETICNDTKTIQSRWLEMDTEWFNRARIIRIEVCEKLKSQYQRLLTVISTDEATIKEKLYAEQLATQNLDKYESIGTSMDPEEYLKYTIKKKMQESEENKPDEE